MMRKRVVLIGAVIVTVVFVGCSLGIAGFFIARAKHSNAKRISGNVETSGSTAAASLNKLAFIIFSRIAQGRSDVFFSPLSIAIALGVLDLGATPHSRTQREIEKALGGVLKGGSSLGTPRDANEGVNLITANSLWTKRDFVKSTYVSDIELDFGAEVHELPQNSSEVNNWVNKKTKGLIRNAISDIPPNLTALIVNAVFFEGTWTTSFDYNSTQAGPFLVNGKDLSNVSMMTRKSSALLYGAVDIGPKCTIQLAELPYGKMNSSLGNGTSRFSAVIALPCEGQTIDHLLPKLMDGSQWLSWISKLSMVTLGTFSMPKFKIDTPPTSFRSVFENIGVRAAFNGENGGGFSRISENPTTVVSDIVHAAVIDVNEHGTEAAASSAIAMASKSRPQEPMLQMIVNRPFIFVIRDRNADTVIFVGRVDTPTAAF